MKTSSCSASGQTHGVDLFFPGVRSKAAQRTASSPPPFSSPFSLSAASRTSLSSLQLLHRRSTTTTLQHHLEVRNLRHRPVTIHLLQSEGVVVCSTCMCLLSEIRQFSLYIAVAITSGKTAFKLNNLKCIRIFDITRCCELSCMTFGLFHNSAT